MNWKVISYLTLITVFSGVFFSCYKTKNFSTNLTAQIDSAIVVQSYDQARVTALLDEVFNEVDSAMGTQTLSGSITPITLCGTQITVDTVGPIRFISITYDGNSCDNTRTRGGNVTIYYDSATSWQNANDTIGVNINELSVADVPSDSNHVRLNGTFYYVNTTGGSLSTLTPGATQVHQIFSNYMGIVFEVADTATWQVARNRSYTNTGNGLMITTTGIDSVGGIADVSEWGGNRYGNSFITSIDTPLVSMSACGYQVTSGQVQLTNPTGATTLTFGLNASGAAATGCPVSGGYYYFGFSWTGSDSNPYSTVRPYPY